MTIRRYYVCDTKAEAEQVERAIRDAGFGLAAEAGTYVSVYGMAAHRWRAPDPDDPEDKGGFEEDRSVRTKDWDEPVQRADTGDWVVLHPSHHAIAESRPDALAALETGIEANFPNVAEADALPSWWPNEQ